MDHMMNASLLLRVRHFLMLSGTIPNFFRGVLLGKQSPGPLTQDFSFQHLKKNTFKVTFIKKHRSRKSARVEQSSIQWSLFRKKEQT